MIKDLIEWTKDNKQDFYPPIIISACTTFVLVGTVGSLMLIDGLGRTFKYARYENNLKEYRQCAIKINDPLMVDKYCGNSPNEPL